MDMRPAQARFCRGGRCPRARLAAKRAGVFTEHGADRGGGVAIEIAEVSVSGAQRSRARRLRCPGNEADQPAGKKR